MRQTAAVMQPYFFPYAGYFRLLAQADVFVILDSVQQRKGGRVHRCEVPAARGGCEWLTLPLRPCSVNTRISDLRFAADADATWRQRLARHRWIAAGQGDAACAVREFLCAPLGTHVVDLLEAGLALVAGLLGIDTEIVRSSDLAIDTALRGSQRVLAIVESLGARRYLNAPGGRALYEPADFAQRGIELSFCTDYRGPHRYLLHDLMCGPLAPLRSDVLGEA